MNDLERQDVIADGQARLSALLLATGAEMEAIRRDVELRTGVNITEPLPRVPGIRTLTWADMAHMMDQFAAVGEAAELLTRHVEVRPERTIGSALKAAPPAVAERALALLVESGIFGCEEGSSTPE